MTGFPYREQPCANCPWRRDSPVGEFPPERYEALRETAGRPGGEVPIGAPVFACHKSSEDNTMACAGWLAVCGYEHLGIRYNLAIGRLPASALTAGPGWPPLFGSYEELAERNGAVDG